MRSVLQPTLALGAMIAVVVLDGCISNPVNAYTGSQYFNSAQAAERRGDLDLAAKDYSRAYENCVRGNLGPNAEAHTLYEFARVSFYRGQFEKAEKYFPMVLELIEKTNGVADSLRPPTLCEYARMLHDAGQDSKAVPIYREADNSLQAARTDLIYPMEYSIFLDDYSDSLKIAGFVAESVTVAKRAAAIRDSHPNQIPRSGQSLAYSTGGHTAEAHGDWEIAQKFFARAVVYGEKEQIPKMAMATTYYELGRCFGVLGDFDESESNLKRALSADTDSGQETFMDLTELARLNMARGRFSDAIGYFETDFRRLVAANADMTSPIAYADLLAEYAECLKKVGRTKDADEALQRSAALRSANPGKISITDHTPYGKYSRSHPLDL
jgi:tetratricopeptide (TPR) repeat protein